MQVAEEMALAQLEEDAMMQRDEDGDGVPDAFDEHDNRADDPQVGWGVVAWGSESFHCSWSCIIQQSMML
jgi:hypothetical protein